PGEPIIGLSDEFNGTGLSSQWHFVHDTAKAGYRMTGAEFEARTVDAFENADASRVSMLAEPAPEGDYMVETRVTTSVPFDGSCCYNFAEAGLFIYGNDENSIKLALFSDFNTRQIEFGKQVK